MFINPAGSQNLPYQLQYGLRNGRSGGANSSLPTDISVDTPINEISQPAVEEVRQAPSLKASEALRALVNQETAQVLAGQPKNIVSPKQALKAYNKSNKQQK